MSSAGHAPEAESASEMFLHLAGSSRNRAPLHAAVCSAISNDEALSSLLDHAPPTQRQPVLVLAAIHSLVLAEPQSQLAEWYPALATTPRPPDDPALANAVAEFVSERESAVVELVASRRTQTNEVGRCALLLAAMSRLDDVDVPLAHIDIGTSAGLNLLLPHFSYRYDGGDLLGDGALTINCSSRRSGFAPTAMPQIAASVGIDSAPIDATDPSEARWLLACVWPDQIDRIERLSAALAIAQQRPPDTRNGDAVADLASIVAEVDKNVHPLLTHTWVLNYLSTDQRLAFINEVDRLGTERDLSLIYAESPSQTPELAHPEHLRDAHTTVMTLVTWRNGHKTTTFLAECHPHGYWYDRIG